MDVFSEIDEALLRAEGLEEYATPESALRWLLECSWADLLECQRRAVNGVWSIECDTQVQHIVGLTRLVGPTPWENVQADLVVSGVYEHLNRAAGHPTPLSGDDLRRAREVIARRY